MPTAITTSPNELIPAAEVCRILQLSHPTVQRLVKKGLLKSINFGPGTRPRYRKADVVAFARAAGFTIEGA